MFLYYIHLSYNYYITACSPLQVSRHVSIPPGSQTSKVCTLTMADKCRMSQPTPTCCCQAALSGSPIPPPPPMPPGPEHPPPLGVLLITMLLGLLPPLVPPTPPPSGFDWLPPWGWDPESGDPRDSASSTLPTRLRRRSSSCVDSGRGLDVVGLVSKAANRLCEIVAERKDADQVS